jgi:hypothetical protein
MKGRERTFLMSWVRKTGKVNSEPCSILCHKNNELLLLSEVSDENVNYVAHILLISFNGILSE